jgi:lipoyl-dependent peroxiredoxin subunit C
MQTMSYANEKMINNRILGVGYNFPEFKLPAVVSIKDGSEFAVISNEHIKNKWGVLFFWPLDFTFVCPTEIIEFNKSYKEFSDKGAVLLGVSTDSKYVHLAWRRENPKLRELQLSMLADNKKELSEALGILHPDEKVPLRATYIVDPNGVIRWLSINDLGVGRNVKEVLRTLEALQTGEFCPCNWTPGDATL